jgi:glycosyltransferase involved in cell wall biosynthesis
MKVLLVGPFPDPIDGCSYANKILVENLQVANINYDKINTNTPVISSKQGNKFSLKKALSFIPIYLSSYKVIKADVVYFTPGQTFFGILKYSPFILLCILLNRPYVIHVHGNYLGQQYRELGGIKKKIFSFLIAHASAGIVLSKSLVRNFEALLPLHKVYIVENFVSSDLNSSPLIPKRTDKLHVIYLSNLMKEKGILDVLDALLILKKKNIAFEATIAGSMETGIKNEVESRLNDLNGYVEYVKTITGSAKKEKLINANVFILPTYYKMEGQPISLLEGLATGNIIISTAHAGIPDVVGPENGYLVQPQSPQQIADCLIDINKDIPSNINKFSRRNYEYIAESFTEHKFSNTILKILQTVSR